jgi:hypothetical protein
MCPNTGCQAKLNKILILNKIQTGGYQKGVSGFRALQGVPASVRIKNNGE